MIWSLPSDSPHPAAHGGPEFRLEVADGVVVSAEVRPGRMHRGVEKLMESRDYRSALVLATRHDWLGSVSSEVGLAQLLERQMGLAPPARAVWIRVLLVEYMRIAHHLLWLSQTAQALAGPGAGVRGVEGSGGVDAAGAAGGVDGVGGLAGPAASGMVARDLAGPAASGMVARDLLLDAVEELTGARMHLMVATPGGVRCDPSNEWLDRAIAVLPLCVDAAGQLADVLGDGVDGPGAGVAELEGRTGEDFSVSGPVARGSGLAWDLRAQKPEAPYVELADVGAFSVVVEEGGDAAARFRVLTGEVAVSAACVVAAAERLVDMPGPVAVRLPKVIRVPAGSGYWAVESPTGTSGWFLVSTGGTTPHRLGMRTASFNNAAVMEATLPGTSVEDLALAVMSHMVVSGDLDA